MKQNDSLVYTPAYLMEMLISDLEQCDMDRIELKKLKAEQALIYVENAQKAQDNKRLSNSLSKEIMKTDSLETVIMQMNIDHSKQLKKQRKRTRAWFATAILSIGAAVGIHYDWKNGWTDKYR
jgi:hypothetical protein